jgi:hypothetical protein
MLYAEGHPAKDGRLGAATDLPASLEELTQGLRDVGIPMGTDRYHDGFDLVESRPGAAGIRRMDVTVDVASATSGHGIALLAGIAALSPARLQSHAYRAKGAPTVETVTWQGARGLMARAYDKGVEAGTAGRGEVIRLEAQYRWSKELRRGPEELTAKYMREKFVSRFLPMWKASDGIKVVGAVTFVEELRSAVQEDRLTVNQAEQVLGYQLLSAGDRAAYPDRTRQRRQRLIQETGLVLSHGDLEEVSVDLHEVLESVLVTDAWGNEG